MTPHCVLYILYTAIHSVSKSGITAETKGPSSRLPHCMDQQIPCVAPSPRREHISSPVENKLYMWGGGGGSEPSPRSRHFSEAVQDRLCVWGGNGGRGSVVTSIVHHYDPDSETWNTNTCEGPHPPGIHHGACASAGHHLYTYGGWDEGWNEQGTLHLLDTRSRRWKLISSEGGPMRKTGSRMVVYDSKIVVFGGLGKSGRTNELHTFNLKEGERKTPHCYVSSYAILMCCWCCSEQL